MTARQWPTAQPVLVGEGITLGPLLPSDVGDVVAACQDADIQQYTRVPVPYATADAEAFVALCASWWHEGTSAVFAVRDTRTGAFAGVVGVHEVDWATGVGELGYWTAPATRGRGVATRGLRALIAWALRDGRIRALTAEVMVGNAASERVLARAGLAQVDTPVVTRQEAKGEVHLTTWALN